MNDSESESETITELIDKIIGFSDGQPLILNHLHVLKTRTEALILRLGEFEADTSYQKLAAELDSTSAQLHEQKEANERLEYDLAKSKKKPKRRHKIEERILLHLMANDNQPSFQIADAIGIGQQVAELHLGTLRRDYFVGFHTLRMENVIRWSLENPGRAYLSSIKKLK